MEKKLDDTRAARQDTAAEAAMTAVLAAADTGDFAKMEPWLAPNAVHFMNGLVLTNDELHKRAVAFKTAFPDIRRDLRPIASAHGTVTVRGWITGTHRGEFMGMAATGNEIKVSALGFCQIDGSGKVVELEVQMNFFALMEQLRGKAS